MLTDDYTLEQFKELFEETDEATINDLYSFYSYRTPCDNFSHFIKQTELMYVKQYNKLLRDENVTYDAMVSDYMERLVIDDRSGNSSRTGTGTNTETTTGGTTENGTAENTRTDDLTQDTSGTNNSTRTDDLTQTGTTESSSNTSGNTSSSDINKNVSINKTNPQVVNYSVTAGTMPGLTWDSSDNQTQQETNVQTTTTSRESVTENGNNSIKNTGTTTTSQDDNHTVTNTGTVTDNGKTTKTVSSNEHKTGNTTTSDSSTTSETGTTKERYTGRRGYTPAEMLEKSRNYIMQTNAFKWLCERYNRCFVWNIEV